MESSGIILLKIITPKETITRPVIKESIITKDQELKSKIMSSDFIEVDNRDIQKLAAEFLRNH